MKIYHHCRCPQIFLQDKTNFFSSTSALTVPELTQQMLQKKLANKIFGHLARCGGKFRFIDPSKSKFWVKSGSQYRIRFCQNLQFRFLNNWVSGKWEIGTSKLRKNAKSTPQNLKLNCDLEFSIEKSNFWNPKSISKIPHESFFET